MQQTHQLPFRSINGGADGYQCHCATSSFFKFITGVLAFVCTIYGVAMACRGCSGLYIETEPKDPMMPLMTGGADPPATTSENPVADSSGGVDPVTVGSTTVTATATGSTITSVAALEILMRCHAQAERQPLAAGALALLASLWMAKWSMNMWWEWLFILTWTFCIFVPCCGPCLPCLPCFTIRKADADAGRQCNRTATTNCRPKCWCPTVTVIFVGFMVSELAAAMWLGCNAECEVEGFFGDYFFSQGNILNEPLMRVEFEPVHREVLGADYFGLYTDFLQQPFAQPCAIGNAVDALIGPAGVLREALERDHDHWDMEAFSLDGEVDYLKHFVAARFENVQQLVEAKCDSLDGGCLTGATCLTMACPINTTCVQGSLTGACVGPDRCGCSAYSGWSKKLARCTSGGQTDEDEVAACAAGRPLVRPPDACRCVAGSGYSTTADGCVEGATTSKAEARACQLVG